MISLGGFFSRISVCPHQGIFRDLVSSHVGFFFSIRATGASSNLITSCQGFIIIFLFSGYMLVMVLF